MKLRPLSLLLVSLLFWVPALQATIYYVDNTVTNDNGGGTSTGTAWKTLAKVNSYASSPGFTPGDEIRFKGGQTFTFSTGAGLYIAPGKGGTLASPITFTSYGTGKATLVAANDKEFAYAYNAAGLKFTNLIIKGNGSTTHTKDGIAFYTDTANTRYAGITLQNVEIYGFGKSGFVAGGWNGTAGFSDILIEDSSFHDNAHGGAGTYSQGLYGNLNITVRRCKFYNNTGVLNALETWGNGIVLGGAQNGLIEHCEAYNNGTLNNNPGAGPGGIWVYRAKNIVIQYNESHHNRTQNADGLGFDIDGGSEDCVIQYNYAHDNDGAGYLFAQYVGAGAPFRNNVIRYNVSQNDAKSSKGYGAIMSWGGDSTNKITNCQIYGNTVYLGSVSHANSSAFYAFGAGGYNGLVVRNNIFVTTGGRRIANLQNYSSTANAKLEGNNYYSSGAAWLCSIGGTNYSSLSAYRASGQEIMSSVNVGNDLNPLLLNPGNAGTIAAATPDNTTLATALTTFYKVASNSPMINAGVTPPTLTATGGTVAGTAASQDFFGGSVPLNGYDIGVHENAGTVATPVITAGQTSGTLSTVFNYQIAASNSPTSYALASGSLPAGVILNTTTGVLSGTPSASGTFTPSFTATNAGGTSPAVTVTISIFSVAIKVACVGDSITAGHGLTTPQTYPAKLSAALGSGYIVTNYGLSGAAAMIASRSPDQSSYWSSSQFTNAKAALPNIVIFMLGTNDSKTTNDAKRGTDQVNFVADYKDLVDQFLNLASAPTVYICTPYYAAPFYTGANAFTISDTTLNTIIKPWVELIAAEKNCPLINIHGIQSGALANYIANDIIHPNDTGTTLIANAISQALLNGVTATPSLNKTSSTLAFGPLVTNWPSTSSFTLSATHLTSALTVSVPSGQGFAFKVGTGSFVTSATLTPVNGVIPMTTITVRFNPTAAQAYSTTLSLSGGGVTTQNVALSGSGLASAATLTGYLTTPFSSALGTLPGATYALASGTLPPGLSLDTSTGVLSGTPTQTGSYSPSFTATTTDGVYTLVQPINVVPALSGTLLSYEGFNYTASTSITGLTGGTGWRSPSNPSWTSSGTTGTVAASGLTYTAINPAYTSFAPTGLAGNYGGILQNNRLPAIDAGAAYATAGLKASDGNYIGGATVSGTLWGSYLVAANSWSSPQMLSNLDSTAGTGTKISIRQTAAGSAISVTDVSGGGIGAIGSIPTASLSTTTPNLIVFRYVFNGASNDTFDVWLNPTTATDTPAISVTSANFIFNNLTLRSVNANGGLVFDEIRLGTSFPIVTPYT
ncbi:MAG: putative Ig domain-containing protein, partial [Burkholderiales bacterium]|nr:putative Ig domain-containing protein [Opitutaceae bacterium]